MPLDVWSQAAAVLALVGLILYVVLGGADFGGGVLDLLARGPRKDAQRRAIAHAMGPVWEANHVWLIFVIVVLFTCFPHGYAALATALFVPIHLALLGIVMRGAAFVFRGFLLSRQQDPPAPRLQDPAVNNTAWDPAAGWGTVFGVASVVSPFLLGAIFGTLTAGDVQLIEPGRAVLRDPLGWLSTYSLACGLLALSACAYLASVYLLAETSGELRDDFRWRAVETGTVTAALAGIVPVLASRQAEWFMERLMSVRTLPVVVAGLLMFALSAWAVFGRQYRVARVFAAGEIALVLLSWGITQYPYLAYPDITLANSAGPVATTRFLVLSVPVGAAALVPSLWLLFAVFKGSGRGRWS